MRPYPELDRLAARQQHLVTLAQCRRMGLTSDHVRYCARSGLMVVVRPGVYRWCGARPSWRMMAMAAVLAAGDDAVLSHRSAGALWELLAEERDEDASIEITDGSLRRLAGVRSHRHKLEPNDRTKRFGIPVTTVERTLLDLGESCGAGELGGLIDEALRRRLTTLPKLERALERHAGPGRRRTRPFVEALVERGAGHDPGDNEGELRMDRLWDQLGLPAAERQYRVRLRGHTYVLDRAIVELKIGIEWNGRERHGLWSRFRYDSDRRNDLVAAGWLILDFTMKTRPERIERTVRAAVEQRKLLVRSA